MTEPVPVPYKATSWETVRGLPPTRWLIDNFLPHSGSVLLYGSGNTGKTMITLDWALRLATGVSWFGVPLEHARVLYAYGEGVSDLPKRVQAWSEGNNLKVPESNIAFLGIMEPINLRWDPESPNTIPVNVHRLLMQVDIFKPDVVFLDPVQELFAGMDGNSDREVMMVFRIKKELERRGVAVVFVHHMRKAGDTFRGATTWRDLADVGLALEASERDHTQLSLIMDRNRFGPKLSEWDLTLQSIILSNELPKLEGETGVYLGSSRRADATGKVGDVFRYLVDASGAGRTVPFGEFVTELDFTKSGVDKSLKDLMEAGMIEKGEGKMGKYDLTDKGRMAADDVGFLQDELKAVKVARRQRILELQAEEVEEL
jgi:DNA-binding MarR family transcriptional regulator